MINALELADKVIEDAKIVCLGAGAAAIACMKLLVSMGAKAENIYMLDRKGVIHAGRDDLNEYKAIFATETDKRTLTDALKGADVFVGLSGPNLLPPADLKLMAENPSCVYGDWYLHTSQSRFPWAAHTSPSGTTSHNIDAHLSVTNF